MKNVLSSNELKRFWDKFTTSYLKTSKSLDSLFATMCDLTMLEDPMNKQGKIKNVLEMACGPGKGLIHLANIFQGQNATICGTDLSTNMLDVAFDNLSKRNDINIEYKNFRNHPNSRSNESEKPTVNLYECDNENMNIFPDKKFDVILSNNSLHLVADPNRMLREAHRLIKDDGVACFTIWGRPENSFYFTLIPNTLKKLKVPLPNLRSNFHLSKESTLHDLLKANGFSKINICYMFIPFPVFKPEDFYHNLDAPIYLEVLEKMDDNTKREFLKEIDTEINNKLDKNEFIGAEFILIASRKF